MEGIAPILHVADARASVDWYAQLGFEVESEHAFGPDWPLYMRLRRGPAQLHLSEHRLDGGPASHVYLYVEDADSSLPPATAAEDCPWGMREARLTDLTATSCTSVLRSRSGTGSTSLIGGVPHPFQNEPVGTCTLACAVCQRPPCDLGSSAVAWASCPCTPGCASHLLLTCLVCRGNGDSGVTSLPECVYLGV
jgi:hypothetical protein